MNTIFKETVSKKEKTNYNRVEGKMISSESFYPCLNYLVALT